MPAANLVGWMMRPLSRLIVGIIAIPVLRAVRRRIPGLRQWDAEFEKDIEQWFRGSLLLLVATKNAEIWLMTQVNAWLEAGAALRHGPEAIAPEIDLSQWWITAGRLLLAIGVVECMPDQGLFSIIHPGPTWSYDRRRTLWENLRLQCGPVGRGLVCQHLNRASPMFAILSVFFGGPYGWVFYGLAIVQYLIIGLVTSRDRALDVLSQFDRAVAERRQEILSEFEIPRGETPASHPLAAGAAPADRSKSP